MDGAVNFAALEVVVEDLRLAGDWAACRVSLDQYAQIFEITSPYSTPLHGDTRSMKAYYWICMAEVTFYTSGDFDQAIDLVRRAMAMNSGLVGINIIIAKILVRSCFELINKEFGSKLASPARVEAVKFDRSIERATIPILLGGRYQELSVEARLNIDRFNIELYPPEVDLLTTALASLAGDDFAAVCQSFASFVSTLSVDKLAACMVLSCCRYLLRGLSLDLCPDLMVQGHLSAYSLWLHLDGALTCSAICEVLSDYAAAKEMLDRIIVPLSVPSVVLPVACQPCLVFALCRRPLVAARCLGAGKAIGELEGLFAPPQDGGMSFAALLPLPLRLALTLSLAGMLVDRAQAAPSLEAMAADLLDAYRYLKYSLFLPFHDAETVAPAFDRAHDLMKVLLPVVGSSLHYLDTADTNPLHLAAPGRCCLGHAAVLLAGLTLRLSKSCGRSLSATSAEGDDYSHPTAAFDLYGEVDALLAWGYHVEVEPNPLVLYLRARSYLKSQRPQPAMQALERCHACLFPGDEGLRGLGEQDRAVADRAAWLGILTAPLAAAPHIPLVQLVDMKIFVEDGSSCGVAEDGALRLIRTISRALGAVPAPFSDALFLGGDIDRATEKILPGLLGEPRRIDDGLGRKFAVSLDHLMAGLAPLQFPRAAGQSEEESTVTGLNLLIALARVLAAHSRDAQVPYEAAFVHACHAARLVGAVLRTVDDRAAVLQYEAVELKVVASLELAVLLAELRLIAEATACAEAVLRSSVRDHAVCWPALEKRYTHLIVLLLSVQTDSLQASALATVMAERLVTGLGQAPAAAAVASEAPTEAPARWNFFYTHLLVTWAAGESAQALTLAQALLASIREHVDPERWARPHLAPLVGGSGRAKTRATPHPIMRLPLDVRTVCVMLVGLARIFGKLRRFSLAKAALGDAWQCLYALPTDLAARLTELVATEAEATKHEEMDLLRYVPTLLGWRLAEGCGLARAHDTLAEAEVLAETARLVQLEERDLLATRAQDLYALAVATCPTHVPTLCALAQVHLERFMQEARLQQVTGALAGGAAPDQSGGLTEASSRSLATAHYYVRAALRHCERSPEAWHVYGLIAEKMVSQSVALEAELTAVDCLEGLPVRPFAAVLW